jgi:uncharacterized protein (DUF1499 family)
MAIFMQFVKVIAGLGMAIAGLSVFMAILSRFVKRPTNLGVKDGKLAPCANMPNCVSTQTVDPRHQIEPLHYSTSQSEAQATLSEVVRSMERAEIITEEPGYIYAEFRTKGMGYVDDVEFAFDPETQIIHFRSSSRLPYSDWGVNRRRMEQIRAAYTAVQ